MAKLFPLLKPGKKDTSLPFNHRGITLTYILSKVLKKIVHEQVTDYFTECEALSDDQYGFRKGRSCPDLLLTAVDDWGLAKDVKQYTAVGFADLSKAFDCVRHDLLLQTLQSHGLEGTMLKWFQHYLTDRQQCIMLQDPPLTFNCSKGARCHKVVSWDHYSLTYTCQTSEVLERNSKLHYHHLLMTSPCMFHELHRRQLAGSFRRRSPSWRTNWKTVDLLSAAKKQLLCSSLPTRVWRLHLTIAQSSVETLTLNSSIRPGCLELLLTVLSVGVLKLTTFAAKLGARLERYADPFANLHNMLAESSFSQSFNLTLNTLPSCLFR